MSRGRFACSWLPTSRRPTPDLSPEYHRDRSVPTTRRVSMRLKGKRPGRSGATMVEYAIVLTILVFLMLGTIIAAIGVFYYQQVSLLAREGSRYASVHGAEYAREEKVPAATAQDIYNNAIVPKMAGLDPNLLTYSVTWNTNNNPYHAIVLGNGN